MPLPYSNLRDELGVRMVDVKPVAGIVVESDITVAREVEARACCGC